MTSRLRPFLSLSLARRPHFCGQRRNLTKGACARAAAFALLRGTPTPSLYLFHLPFSSYPLPPSTLPPTPPVDPCGSLHSCGYALLYLRLFAHVHITSHPPHVVQSILWASTSMRPLCICVASFAMFQTHPPRLGPGRVFFTSQPRSTQPTLRANPALSDVSPAPQFFVVESQGERGGRRSARP